MSANHPLRRWRHQHRRTLVEAAELIGCSKSTAAGYELGLRFPRPAVLARIEVVTGGEVTAADMLTAYQSTRGERPNRPKSSP